MNKKPTIAVIGCGLGGATATALLQHLGCQVKVFEQAPGFLPAGAGIHLSPNVLKVLRQIGVEHQLLVQGFQPASFTSRAWNSGELLFDLPLGEQAVQHYGGAYLTVHRGELHRAIVDEIDRGCLVYGRRLKSLVSTSDSVQLHFEDGHQETADLVIGADGLSSTIRKILIGDEPPVFSGQVAFRSMFSTDAMHRLPENGLTKWWAPDRFVIAYYLTKALDTFYFVAGFPAKEWSHHGASTEGTQEELLHEFAGFHPEVQMILRASPPARKWPLFERDANPIWHRGRVALLGDACHPMRPHMAQGAAMAIEDAAVLSRCLMEVGFGQWEQAFSLYSRLRLPRTSRVQKLSGQNTWLKKETDPSWVFSYDAWTEPLSL